MGGPLPPVAPNPPAAPKVEEQIVLRRPRQHVRRRTALLAGAAASLVVAVTLGPAALAASQVANPVENPPLTVLAVDDAAYPTVEVRVGVDQPAGPPFTSSAFGASAGGRSVPVTATPLDLADLRLVLAVDPGPTESALRSVQGGAEELVTELMPGATVTVVVGGSQPRVLVPATKDKAVVSSALLDLTVAPASTLDTLDLAVTEAQEAPADSAVVALVGSPVASTEQAAAVAAHAEAAAIPVSMVIPDATEVPTALEALDPESTGSVVAGPSVLATAAAVGRIGGTLAHRYDLRLQLPDGPVSDLTVGVNQSGIEGLAPVAVQAPRVTGTQPGPTTTPIAAPTTAAVAVPTSGGGSDDGPNPAFIAEVVAVALLILGAIVATVVRRGQTAPRHAKQQGPGAFRRWIASAVASSRQRASDRRAAELADRGEPGPSVAVPPGGPRVDGPPPAAPVATTPVPPRPVLPPEPAPRPARAPVLPLEPATAPGPAPEPVAAPAPERPGPALLPSARRGVDEPTPVRDRRPIPSVSDRVVARSQPGARWWSYQRPDPAPAPAPAVDPRPDDLALAPAATSVADLAAGPLDDDVDPWVEPAGPDRSGVRDTSFALPMFIGGGLILLAAILGHAEIAVAGPYLIPLGALILAGGFGRLLVTNHPDEPWLGKLLVLGVAAKLTMSYIRYLTLVNSYKGQGDASAYDTSGRAFVAFWNGHGPNPDLLDLRKTNFLRWFTGVVYYVFGANFLAGFFVFGLLAVIGSYLWYRASADAVPYINRRLYLCVMLFAPSITFWPSSIGKEALMQLGIGVMALGVARLMRARLVQGLALCASGGWLLWVVRPHLLAMVAIAGGAGYAIGRVRTHEGQRASILARPAGMLIVAVLVIFTVSQGAKFLGLKDLSAESIQTQLDAQTERSDQGGSSFDNGGNTLNPLHLPQGAVTVLLRPFPWEVDSTLQILSSLESAALAIFILLRLGSLRVALARSRLEPFLMYCWVLTLLYCMTFSSFANFGLLVRQRSLVLPALYVLLSVDPALAKRYAARAKKPAVPEVELHAQR